MALTNLQAPPPRSPRVLSRVSVSLAAPPSFCPKSRLHQPACAERNGEQLTARRLKEYTLQWHASVAPNHTYADCERFARLLQEVGGVEAGLAQLAGARRSLQEDAQALLAVYGQKESRYREEGDAARKRLLQVHYEFRKLESGRRQLQDHVRAAQNSLQGVAARHLQRHLQLDGLRQELGSQLQWLQEVLEGGGPGSGPASGVERALKELLRAGPEATPLPESG